jgi:hypothetical protein
VSAMADSDEFQEAGASNCNSDSNSTSGNNSNSNITDSCAMNEKHTSIHTSTKSHTQRTEECVDYNTGDDIHNNNSNGDNNGGSPDQTGLKRQNTYKFPIRSSLGRATMHAGDSEDSRQSPPRTHSEFNPLPNPTSPTLYPSHTRIQQPPRDRDSSQIGSSALGTPRSRSEEDLIAQMKKKQRQWHLLSKD